MPRLTLQKKVFFALAALLVALLLIFAGFSRFGLQRGLGPYVAEIELGRMRWVADRLERNYAQNGGWRPLQNGEDAAWQQLLFDRSQPRGTARPLISSGGGLGMRFPGPPPDAFWGGTGMSPPPRDGLGEFESSPPQDFDPPPQSSQIPPSSDQGSDERPPSPRFDGPRGPGSDPDSIYRRLGITNAKGDHIAGATVDAKRALRLPLRHAAQVVGFMVLAPLEDLASDADEAFLAQQSRFMIWTGLAGLAIALLLSWLLARRWFAPIGELMDGARGIAQGRFDTRVRMRGHDELGTLARTFNHMAMRLDSVESSRRAWLADVAHELRTPLAAMRAEIEALQDGVRTFDEKTAIRLHRQVMRLGQLVDDLRLSMSDAAMPLEATDAVEPLALLEEAAASMRERFARAGIALDMAGIEAPPPEMRSPRVVGDARRLHQVFMNLFENSLRYTDAGGLLRVSVAPTEATPAGQLALWFDDTAPGVAEDERPLIFDRLYRCEASRDRLSGGSGLGLAICRSVVVAHGGRIEADASPLGGLRIALTLPLTEPRP